ncbi:toxin RelE [Bifidobacterium ramosum]|uniref:Toxin RelE n=1 Tax=Bifidobacterium ramosum TaxID=1798158 RepID=A0A6L4WZQ6_9BIFI|nr:type II toxin-antitoxin system RelE/ParE family toxin [Bifidobacterium ramosum]KAB8287846.1 toxin RelE [Bifidobacterium ramosum]NEG71207.1 type II toxin-antitoxin system RelE/ParE family toxin [Bifidobacterium ramosum]
MPKFRYYQTKEGTSPFVEWMGGLRRNDRAKVYATIRNIELFGIGIALQQGWVKKLDADIWEIRSQFGSNIQRAPFFFIQGDMCVITHGFTKKTQKTPKRELNTAHHIMDRYQEEHDADAII